MVTNTVTGKNWGKGEKEKGKGWRRLNVRSVSLLPITLLPCTRKRAGFTLLELMIVITIIIILAAIVLPQYQKSILATREAVLRNDLYVMRKLIDQYGADKQKLPQSLDDLVTSGYMREKPVDPITGQADWTETPGEDPNLTEGGQGLVDVHSSSVDVGTDGRPYSEW
jgi:general secretion pathway protein G